jgi:hypothetical protein
MEALLSAHGFDASLIAELVNQRLATFTAERSGPGIGWSRSAGYGSPTPGEALSQPSIERLPLQANRIGSSPAGSYKGITQWLRLSAKI